MPPKKDQNTEDDYYANLKEDSKKPEEKKAPQATKAKPKVKAKVKKKVVPWEDTPNTEKKQTKKVPAKPAMSTLTAEEKKEMAKVSSIKKAPAKKAPARKPQAKKVEDSAEASQTSRGFTKKEDIKKPSRWPRKPRQESSSDDKGQTARKPRAAKVSPPKLDSEGLSDISFTPSDRWAPKKKSFAKSEKSFGPDKKASSKKKSPAKKGRKQENMDDFTRSHVLQQRKKEEKKVEDIKQNLTDRSWETVVLPDVISVKEFSEKIWVPITKLMAEFMKNGMMVNLNSSVDFDTASIISEAFDIKVERDNSAGASIDDIMSWDLSELLKEDNSDKLQKRPAVVSIMGHVDHWKTSLLDHIRQAKVAEGEAGWITQSIWAYQVDVNWEKITFLDTPGHEAFTVMRARWAKSTDIAILVVAADEWVKPQTIESISHAKEAGIPVVVAVNKMDKEGANPDHVKGQLAEHGLVPDDWGGDTPMMPVSAKTWEGIDDLLETLVLVSEMQELKANPDRNAIWTVIESHLDKKLGPVATVLINAWTLAKTDNMVCWSAFWKIKVLKNHLSKNIDKAIPWDPVFIVGLDKVAQGWDILQTVSTPEAARKKASEYEEVLKAKKAKSQSGLEVLMSRIKSWMLKNLKIVVKADTNGSLEAIKNALLKISDDEVRITIAHAGVWNINESDVLMASASQTIIVWFNVDLIWKAGSMIEENGIELISHRVIYHITERVEAIATWMLDPKEVEVILWEATVKAIFYDGKKYMVAGLSLKEDNKIEAGAKARVIRWDKLAGKWEIQNLKQWVEDVQSLEWPLECWIQFNWETKLQEGDILEVYKVEIH